MSLVTREMQIQTMMQSIPQDTHCGGYNEKKMENRVCEHVKHPNPHDCGRECELVQPPAKWNTAQCYPPERSLRLPRDTAVPSPGTTSKDKHQKVQSRTFQNNLQRNPPQWARHLGGVHEGQVQRRRDKVNEQNFSKKVTPEMGLQEGEAALDAGLVVGVTQHGSCREQAGVQNSWRIKSDSGALEEEGALAGRWRTMS